MTDTPIPPSRSAEPRFGWPSATVEIGYFCALVCIIALNASHDIIVAVVALYGTIRGGALARRALSGHDRNGGK